MKDKIKEAASPPSGGRSKAQPTVSARTHVVLVTLKTGAVHLTPETLEVHPGDCIVWVAAKASTKGFRMRIGKLHEAVGTQASGDGQGERGEADTPELTPDQLPDGKKLVFRSPQVLALRIGSHDMAATYAVEISLGKIVPPRESPINRNGGIIVRPSPPLPPPRRPARQR